MIDTPLVVRAAHQKDLPCIIRMLAEDALGAPREQYETPLLPSYLAAFSAIAADANNELVVACIGEKAIGVLQLTFIPYLTYQGSWRALIEGVRIDARFRARGFGKVLINWAMARARERGCKIIQLTTDKSRFKAKQFYESLGFIASHEGMKCFL